MGESTNIEWADATISWWWGCTEVSPGCTNCYARTLAARFGQRWGRGAPRTLKKGPAALARRLNRKAKREGRTIRVFSASMSDWLDAEVPAAWLADLLLLVHETQAMTWMLLTKRPELWRVRLEAALRALEDGEANPREPGAAIATDNMTRAWLAGNAPAHVWVGTTVEDQQRADERLPALMAIPAALRFLSCEPLLAPVDLAAASACWDDPSAGIGWIIAGGESGRDARPMHPEWARSLRDQAVAAGVPFFFKQWGQWEPRSRDDGRLFDSLAPHNRDRLVSLDGNVNCSQEAAGEGYACMSLVGKGAAGRLLDGRTWGELPEVRRG